MPRGATPPTVPRAVALARFESCYWLVPFVLRRWNAKATVATPEDWLQEGYLALWMAAMVWPGGGKFSVYAHRAIHNSFVNLLRYMHRAKRCPQTAAEGLRDYHKHRDYALPEIEQFERELDSLRGLERQVVLDKMRGLHSGLSAERNGVSRATVCNRLREIAARFDWPIDITATPKRNTPQPAGREPARGELVAGGAIQR